MRILFFDDDEIRHKAFKELCIRVGIKSIPISAYTIYDAKRVLRGPRIDYAFLDHDLGGRQMVEPGEDTGLVIARAIANMPSNDIPSNVIIHSFNPYGADAMYDSLVSKTRLVKAPFGGNLFKALVAEMGVVLRRNNARQNQES